MDTGNGISYHYYLKARTAWEFADVFTDSSNWDNSLKAVNENVKKDSNVLSQASENGQSKVVCQKSELLSGQQISNSWIAVDAITREADIKEAVEEHLKEDIASAGSCANHEDGSVNGHSNDVRMREEPKNDDSHYYAPSVYGENYESTLLTGMDRDLIPPIDEPNESCLTTFVTYSFEPSSSDSLAETETHEVPCFESDRSDMVQPVININPVKEEPMELNTACNAPVTLDNGLFPPNVDVIPLQATIPYPIPYPVVPVTTSCGNQNNNTAICEDPASNSDLELGNAPVAVARTVQKEEADHIVNTEDDEDSINDLSDGAVNAPERGTHENGAGNTTTSINMSKAEETVTDEDQSAYKDLFIYRPVSIRSDCQLEELTCKYCHRARIRSHKGDRANICVHCDQVFANPIDLREHFETHRKEKKFVCPHCCKEFKNLSALLFHHNLHKDRYFQIKVFKFEKCRKVFSEELNLRTNEADQQIDLEHAEFKDDGPMFQHTDQNVAPMDSKPGSMYITNDGLESDSVKDFAGSLVNDADAEDSIQDDISALDVPSTSKRFNCSLCDKSYKRSYDLNRHVKGRHENVSFPCSFCEKRFFRKDRLKSHVKNKHKSLCVDLDSGSDKDCQNRTIKEDGTDSSTESLIPGVPSESDVGKPVSHELSCRAHFISADALTQDIMETDSTGIGCLSMDGHRMIGESDADDISKFQNKLLFDKNNEENVDLDINHEVGDSLHFNQSQLDEDAYDNFQNADNHELGKENNQMEKKNTERKYRKKRRIYDSVFNVDGGYDDDGDDGGLVAPNTSVQDASCAWDKFSCGFCERSYKYMKGLNRHITDKHNGEILPGASDIQAKSDGIKSAGEANSGQNFLGNENNMKHHAGLMRLGAECE